MTLERARQIQPKPEYRETCLDQLAYLFGRNQYGRSQITGLGALPPLHPHHRPSGADHAAAPWPGLLVGGGQSATDWKDEQDKYSVNEVAINWNAPLAYAIAAQLGGAQDDGMDAGGLDGISPTALDANVVDVCTAEVTTDTSETDL